jgi:hypothetical protein
MGMGRGWKCSDVVTIFSLWRSKYTNREALRAAMREFGNVPLIKDVTRDICDGNGNVVGMSASRDMWAKSYAVCFAYLLPGRFAGRGGFLTEMGYPSRTSWAAL